MKKIALQSTRDGFGKALVELGKKNKDVVVLCADVAESTRTHWFAEKYPERFIEMGVQEQNMIGVAAGLAMEGKIPFATAYAVFSPGRTWDQVRVSVCYSKLNVKIIGCHTGMTVGADGATHQALEDIALMRVLPNMTVIVPCDEHEAYQATIAASKHTGPVYIRLTRENTPVMTSPKSVFEIGKASFLKQGSDVTVIGAGPILYQVMRAVHEMEKEYGVHIQVMNMSTIKPIDTDALMQAARTTGAFVTVEDHQKIGGLGSAVAEFCARAYPIPIEMVGMNDTFGESGPADALIEMYHLDSSAIVSALRSVLKRKKRT
ncbi:MAG TPA: transketolase family protein [Patescibacteria group bacterium]|nr:transketolase family protein [Patescibacteria group bacterium]